MDPIVTKDGSKTIVTKDGSKIVVRRFSSGMTYDGKLYIWDGANWIPRPLLVADPFDRRPVWFRKDNAWHLTQSF
jgi:hypothetical protein